MYICTPGRLPAWCKGAPIVYGLAKDAEVVGVADAMYEANRLPLRHKRGCSSYHLPQQLCILVCLPCTAQHMGLSPGASRGLRSLHL